MSGYPTLRTDSPAHIVLCRLVDLGGVAHLSRLIDVLSPDHQRLQVIRDRVIAPLVERGYVIDIGDATYRASAEGKEYVGAFFGRNLPRCERYEGKPAAPRTAPAFRPLNLARLSAGAPVREGAFDYVSIPSMMGGARVLNGEVVE